jgi:hypothetical protein
MPDRELVRPPAVQMNTRRIVAVGTVVWFAVFLVLLGARIWAASWVSGERREWLWVCLAGWVLGLVGLLIIGKHRREGRTG